MFNPKNMSRDDYKRWEFSPTLVSNLNRCVEILNKSIIDLYYDVDNNFYDENVYREDTE